MRGQGTYGQLSLDDSLIVNGSSFSLCGVNDDEENGKNGGRLFVDLLDSFGDLRVSKLTLDENPPLTPALARICDAVFEHTFIL